MSGVGGRLLLGMLLSAAISWLAYRRRSLSRSGVVGALLLGTTVFGLGGWVWGGLLVSFFTSSSLLSHYRAGQKQERTGEMAKGGQRDLGQTLANGGVAGIIALLIGLLGKEGTHYPPLAFALIGALATANADTWATELGVLSRQGPRLITTGQRVPVGTWGGISLLGTAAALAGAAFIGGSAFVLIQGAAWATTGGWLWQEWIVIPVAALSGLAGALCDSVLGATLQGTYYCPACRKETERRLHRCGRRTEPLRGWGWLDNDWVNFLASLAGAILAAVLGGWALWALT